MMTSELIAFSQPSLSIAVVISEVLKVEGADQCEDEPLVPVRNIPGIGVRG